VRNSNRGQPRVDATPVNTRFPPDELATPDAWIHQQQHAPSRPRAIRRLVELGLASVKPIGTRNAKNTSAASALAGKAIDRVDDTTATTEDRASRKRRLLKGRRNFEKCAGICPRARAKAMWVLFKTALVGAVLCAVVVLINGSWT
jgi:hypothetical protein